MTDSLAPPPTVTARPPAAVDLSASYLHFDYRYHYADLLQRHPHPPVALAELCLFRYWLSSCAYRHACQQRGDLVPATLPPRGWPMPCVVDSHDIESTLGSWIGSLVSSRFDLYERFFGLGRTDDDPLGLDAATLALSCQLFALDAPAMLPWLKAETRRQFAALVSACDVAELRCG